MRHPQTNKEYFFVEVRPILLLHGRMVRFFLLLLLAAAGPSFAQDPNPIVSVTRTDLTMAKIRAADCADPVADLSRNTEFTNVGQTNSSQGAFTLEGLPSFIFPIDRSGNYQTTCPLLKNFSVYFSESAFWGLELLPVELVRHERELLDSTALRHLTVRVESVSELRDFFDSPVIGKLTSLRLRIGFNLIAEPIDATVFKLAAERRFANLRRLEIDTFNGYQVSLSQIIPYFYSAKRIEHLSLFVPIEVPELMLPLDHLKTLELRGTSPTTPAGRIWDSRRGLRIFFSAINPQIESILWLEPRGESAQIIDALSAAPKLTNLAHLELSEVPPSSKAWNQLADKADLWSSLKRFRYRSMSTWDARTSPVASLNRALRQATHLTELGLMLPLADPEIEPLFRDVSAKLSHLDLDAPISDRGLRALAEARSSRHLKTLEITDADFGASGIARLLERNGDLKQIKLARHLPKGTTRDQWATAIRNFATLSADQRRAAERLEQRGVEILWTER